MGQKLLKLGMFQNDEAIPDSQRTHQSVHAGMSPYHNFGPFYRESWTANLPQICCQVVEITFDKQWNKKIKSAAFNKYDGTENSTNHFLFGNIIVLLRIKGFKVGQSICFNSM